MQRKLSTDPDILCRCVVVIADQVAILRLRRIGPKLGLRPSVTVAIVTDGHFLLTPMRQKLILFLLLLLLMRRATMVIMVPLLLIVIIDTLITIITTRICNARLVACLVRIAARALNSQEVCYSLFCFCCYIIHICINILLLFSPLLFCFVPRIIICAS